MMYSFIDTNTTNIMRNHLKFTLNGVNFDDFFNNSEWSFKVLTVSGRDILSENHRVVDIPGRDGQYFLSSTKKERTINIKVLVSAVNDLQFRKLFEELNLKLKSGVLSFSDEQDRFYNAHFVESSEFEELNNQVVLELKFICYDPYKYSGIKRVQGTSINYSGTYDTFPKITINVRQNTNEIRLLNVEKQKYIRLRGSYLAGNIIVIDTLKRTVTFNGRNDLPKLDMVNSRFFSFSKGNNTLNITDNHSLNIEYKEVYL